MTTTPSKADVLFREVQHFRQIGVWFLIIAIAALSWWGFIQQVILGKPYGDNPGPDSLLIAFAVIFGIGLPVFFYFMRLITEVRRDGVYIRFFPFQPSFHKITFVEMTSYKSREYSPMKDFGGWGIRFSTHGKAYNVSGNRGVQIELNNGTYLLIGSRKPEEFVLAIQLGTKR